MGNGIQIRSFTVVSIALGVFSMNQVQAEGGGGLTTCEYLKKQGYSNEQTITMNAMPDKGCGPGEVRMAILNSESGSELNCVKMSCGSRAAICKVPADGAGFPEYKCMSRVSSRTSRSAPSDSHGGTSTETPTVVIPANLPSTVVVPTLNTGGTASGGGTATGGNIDLSLLDKLVPKAPLATIDDKKLTSDVQGPVNIDPNLGKTLGKEVSDFDKVHTPVDQAAASVSGNISNSQLSQSNSAQTSQTLQGSGSLNSVSNQGKGPSSSGSAPSFMSGGAGAGKKGAFGKF